MIKKISSEKSFGCVFFLFFLFIGFYFFKINSYIFTISIIIALFFLISTIFFSRILTVPNLIWYKLAILLSKITTPIIMLLVYFLFVTPTGLIYFFLKKIDYAISIDKSKTTYWIPRSTPIQSMKEQY
jgi:hypothetical protein